MARNELVEQCLELLAPLGSVRARPMFGGHGLYVDELFVALIAAGRLYLKADASSEPAFAAAGCVPFVYTGQGKTMTMHYWTVPAQAMESPGQMQPWAAMAVQAALAARQAPRRRAAPWHAQAAIAAPPEKPRKRAKRP